MKKIIFLMCILFGSLVNALSLESVYTLKAIFVGRREFVIQVTLGAQTSVRDLKEEVRIKLLEQYKIAIPRERLILRKEGVWPSLRDDMILHHAQDGNGMLYVTGRIPPEEMKKAEPMEVD